MIFPELKMNNVQKRSDFMKVSKRVLLFLAGIVWTAAGFNVLRIGVLAYPPYLSILNFLLSLVVFALFWQFVFGKLVKKHTARILSYPDIPHFFLKFFDRKAFFIMAFTRSALR